MRYLAIALPIDRAIDRAVSAKSYRPGINHANALNGIAIKRLGSWTPATKGSLDTKGLQDVSSKVIERTMTSIAKEGAKGLQGGKNKALIIKLFQKLNDFEPLRRRAVDGFAEILYIACGMREKPNIQKIFKLEMLECETSAKHQEKLAA